MCDQVATAKNESPAVEEWELRTVERDVEEEITRLRNRANEMEVALARAPLAIRRMTRIQASKLNMHF